SRVVRLATTTSTDNSGLLEVLLPQFERERGYQVRVISVGTGKALRLGMSGDVDALLVHAPQSEARFIAGGHGVHRRDIMVTDFILIGPADDPAALRDATSAADAFQRLRRGAHAFVSRGDDSGTHKKELDLWRAAGVRAELPWHLQVGQGMGKTLQIADELRAYTLIDRGTWLFLRANSALRPLYQGDPSLRNPYGAIAVNPRRHRINFAGACALIEWLAAPAGQDAIGAYTVNGERLFTPISRAATGE
ncbi:MAG: substrate-binding domain-containing protein, partial [bacterium]